MKFLQLLVVALKRTSAFVQCWFDRVRPQSGCCVRGVLVRNYILFFVFVSGLVIGYISKYTLGASLAK